MYRQHSLTQRWRALAACLAILVAMTAVPAVSAQTADSEDVTVTANIVSPASLVISICDLSADFGSGLNNEGAAPTVTTDTVAATTEGTSVNQGVYYRWTPTCASGSFITIESSVAWDLHQCATDGTSTSSLAIANGDLRHHASNYTSYINANSASTFTACPVGAAQTPVQSSSVGSTTSINRFYYLRVDDDDTPGSFNATTTWEVRP